MEMSSKCTLNSEKDLEVPSIERKTKAMIVNDTDQRK